MGITQNTYLSFGESLKKLFIDFTSVFFLFQIIRFFISHFYFITYLPGFLILWLSYNIISLMVWQQTLGSRFLGISLVNQEGKRIFYILILIRELFTSLPGVLLVIFCFIRYFPANLKGLPLGQLAVLTMWGLAAIIVILLIIKIFQTRIFKIKMTKSVFPKRGNNLKKKKKQIIILYSILLLFSGFSRYIHTRFTNDLKNIRLSCEKLPFTPESNNEAVNRLDWSYYTAPRPTVQSVQKYIDFLEENRKSINDYIFSLFDKYDHIVLCERVHTEMTQYDMIYNLVTDSRFVEKIGNVFTEVGNVDSREAYKELIDTDFPNDTAFQKTLSSFMMENQTYHLLWNNANWFEFLKKMIQFNHKKEKKVEILFTDRANWKYNNKNYNRDSLMANNIITTIKENNLNKSLTIMNYRHAYLQGNENCGYYISKQFQGKVANVLINTVGWDMHPLQNGKWDVAFEQMPENAFAFDFKDSPFGNDRFDHFIFLSTLSKLRYKDMFTGAIFYKPLYLHYVGYGFPYVMQSNNVKMLRERAFKLGETFNEKNYYSENTRYKGLRFPYFAANMFDNIFFFLNLIGGIGLLIYFCATYAKTKE